MIAEKQTKERCATVLRALKMIAGSCDGAARRDDCGFNKFDTNLGKGFASMETITEDSLWQAATLANKYKRQLPQYMQEDIESILESLPHPVEPKFDIDAVPWSEPKIVQTKRGPRQAREWDVPNGSPFWDEWKKGELKQRGYTISKWQGVWRLTEWRTTENETTQETKYHAAKAKLDEGFAAINEEGEPVLSAILQARLDEVSGKLYDYQLPSVRRLMAALEHYSGALDASDTGTGKTYAALAAVHGLGMRAFVICPKAVIPSWEAVAKHFDMKLVGAINYEMLRTGKTGAGKFIEQTNPKSGKKYKKFFFNTKHLKPEEVVIIFDECHRMKDYKTQNCAMGIGAIEQGYKVIGDSATAADNPLQMKFVSLLTRLVAQPAHFFGWMMQHGVQRGRFGMQFVGGKKELLQIHRDIFPRHGTRIRIADLGEAFPETKLIAEAYDMNGASEDIQAIYDEMQREIAALEARMAHDASGSERGEILVAMLRARQRTELLKVPTICNMAEDAIEEGMNVAIFCNFDDSLTAMASRLRTTCVIRGGQKEENRQEIIRMFQRSDRPRLSLICPTFSGQDLKQAFGRVWRAPDDRRPPPGDVSNIIICNIRAGGVGISLHELSGKKSIQKVIFAAGTIEEEACHRVRAKIKRIDALNDGELETALRF